MKSEMSFRPSLSSSSDWNAASPLAGLTGGFAALFAVHPVHGAEEQNVALDRELTGEPDRVAEEWTGLRRHPELARRALVDAGEDAQQRRLPRSVPPYEGDLVARGHVERHVVEGEEVFPEHRGIAERTQRAQHRVLAAEHEEVLHQPARTDREAVHARSTARLSHRRNTP
jgi:hypothetical protein